MTDSAGSPPRADPHDRIGALAGRPVPAPEAAFELAAIRAMPIVDNNEPLIPASFAPDRILTHPRYALEKLPGSVAACFVRDSVWTRLLAAADALPHGYRLVLFDAWRSRRLQQWLFDECVDRFARQDPDTAVRRAEAFVARPDESSGAPPFHLTGAAIDLSIADDQGRLLDMGTAFDETAEASATHHFETSDDASSSNRIRTNRRLLYNAMIDAGFANMPSEWWHYAYGDQLWAWTSGSAHALYDATQPDHCWRPMG